MSKRLAIIGASAGVGLECVRVALERGHHVTTLSRSPVPVPEHVALTRVQGSATLAADLRRALAGADAVLVCLGVGRKLSSLGPTALFSDFGRELLRMQGELGETPVLVLSGFGAGESYLPPVASLMFKLVLARVYRDKTALEQQIEASRLRWVLVRPGVLTDGPSTRPARAQTDYLPGMKVGSISRRTVAEFMVEQAEQPGMIGLKPALSAR